jgi:methylated-DNA-protein-cysteine methyltransferase related protein
MENNREFADKVYEMVKQIPLGKVTTYGAIAEKSGLRLSARTVGWLMNLSIGDPTIPAHRVVNRNGDLTGKMHFPTADYMRNKLEEEGVEFIGERVNMQKHLWLID